MLINSSNVYFFKAQQKFVKKVSKFFFDIITKHSFINVNLSVLRNMKVLNVYSL